MRSGTGFGDSAAAHAAQQAPRLAPGGDIESVSPHPFCAPRMRMTLARPPESLLATWLGPASPCPSSEAKPTGLPLSDTDRPTRIFWGHGGRTVVCGSC